MRKSGAPTVVREGENLLKPFLNAAGSNIADSRERAVPVVAKAGLPDGVTLWAGQKGWYWATRQDPDDNPTAVRFYIPTDAEGKPAQDIRTGDALMLEHNSDTNPKYYHVSNMPPKQTADITTGVTGDPCTFELINGMWVPNAGKWWNGGGGGYPPVIE